MKKFITILLITTLAGCTLTGCAMLQKQTTFPDGTVVTQPDVEAMQVYLVMSQAIVSEIVDIGMQLKEADTAEEIAKLEAEMLEKKMRLEFIQKLIDRFLPEE